MTNAHTRHFTLTRETKGALLYTEVSAQGTPTKGTPEEMFTTLYMRKTAIADGNNWPKNFKVTVDIL
jgi:hypothetical protein